jgi:aryl-alcohol dehydrogenase-like predicted oxidoreductase
MTDLHNIQLGIGTWAWGDSVFWGFGGGYNTDDIRAAYAEIAATPNVLLDTAEVYGLGRSESFIGDFAAELGHKPTVATKCFPYPWRWHSGTLAGALRKSLERLGTHRVALYQMHWPLPPVPIAYWMEAMTEAAEMGLIEHIGVSNYDHQQMQTAYDTLAERGLSLASNQLRYSLLDRTIEYNGLLKQSKGLNIRVIAYSPLAQGLLTGKYSPQNPPPGARGLRDRNILEAVQPLIATMRDIGKAYAVDGVVKTPAQVALNWCIQKGTLPIPGAKNARQASQNLGALGWTLSSDEVAILDKLSDEFHRATGKPTA